MKQLSKLIFILLFLFPVLSFAQSNTPPEPDDEFNLFLLSLLTVFFCAMIGAAIVGAMVALLLLFLVFALVSLGVLSTSIAIGLYKKSFSAGFKSFLLILFGIICTAMGGIGVFMVDQFFDLSMSTTMSFLVGAASGLIGGLLMAIATYHVFRWIIKLIAQKLRLA